MQRVYLSAPYNREFWWNTAVRILNDHYRGETDLFKFNRSVTPPHGSSIMIGGAGVGQVKITKVEKYKHENAKM